MSIMATEILDTIQALRARGEEFCIVTVVRTADATSAKAGAKAVVGRDGTISGFVGGGCVQGGVRRAAAEALRSGQARLIRVRPKEDVDSAVDADGVELHGSACPSGGTVELFVEPMLLAPRVIVFGASPVGAALVSLASAMGYRTQVTCPKADQPRMPGADDYADGFEAAGETITGTDTLVVATQGRGDRPALQAAAMSAAAHVSFVGSRRKAEKLKRDLSAAVSDAVALERIKAPAGLDIGAIEPEEIAVSIMGEIIQWRRRAAQSFDEDEGNQDPVKERERA